MGHAYRNAIILFLFIFIGVQWGFYYEYTSQFPQFKDWVSIDHIHGATMMSWLVLLIIQPALILAGKASLHRKIGKLAYIIGPMILISLFLVMKLSYYKDLRDATKEIALAVRVLDIRGLFSFGIFWALAMINRKDSDVHMRYMIGTGLLMIGPGIGRGLIATMHLSLWDALTVTDLITVAIALILFGSDIYRKKNYKPYLVVLIVVVIEAILWQYRLSAPWQAFAGTWADLFF